MKDPILRSFNNNRRKVNAKGGLHYLKGNKLPHFSLTMESWERAGNSDYGGWREDTFGCAHEELVERWPELKPLADLHLSDINGVPMHGAANGWYWLTGATPQFHSMCEYHGANSNRDWKTRDNPCTQAEIDESFRIFCELARVSKETAWHLQGELLDVWRTVDTYTRTWNPTKASVTVKAAFALWVEAQKPRWKAEADKCRADLGLVIYGDKFTEEAVPA